MSARGREAERSFLSAAMAGVTLALALALAL